MGQESPQKIHAVNESWKGDRVAFNFTSTHEASTKMIVNGLVPYLRFEYGEDAMVFHSGYLP